MRSEEGPLEWQTAPQLVNNAFPKIHPTILPTVAQMVTLILYDF